MKLITECLKVKKTYAERFFYIFSRSEYALKARGLSAGETAIAPLEGTANGAIVDPFSMDAIGVIRNPFRLEVKDGQPKRYRP